MKKRLLGIITALALCLTLCPMGAFATGDTPPTLTPLPKEKVEDIIGAEFKNEYVLKLENAVYSAAQVEDPKEDDITFVCKENVDTKYLAPEGASIGIDPKWYVGNNIQGTKLDAAPKDVGEYTLQASITVTVEGSAGGNDGSASTPAVTKTVDSDVIPFTISPKVITPKLRESIKKPYDGTPNYRPADGESAIDMDKTEICEDDIRQKRISFDGTFYFDTASVGKQKFHGINITKSGEAAANYEFAPNSTAILTPVDGEITQAEAPAVSVSPTLILRNKRAHTYTYALKDLLPALPAGQSYGSITLTPNSSMVYLSSFFGSEKPVEEGKIRAAGENLVMDISEANHTGRNNVAVIVFKVHSTNFQEFALTLNLVGDDKTGVVISGLEPVSPPYDGTPLLGYAGRPEYSLAEGATGTELPEYEASQLDHSYVGIHGTDYGPTEEPPTEPGTYEVTLSIPSSDGDFAGSWTRQFTITRAIVTVTAIERRIKVDDPVPSLSRPELEVDYSVTGLAEGDVLRQAPTMKYATVADSISAGEFQILIDGAMVPDEDHYNPAIKYVPGKLVVTSLSDKDENPFSDVSEYAWYVTAVKYVYNEGLMKGTTNTLFSPTSSLTRGMLVTILYRMEGEPKVWSTSPFEDVDEDEYYYDPIRWANSEGIVRGYGNGRFGPNDALTREHLAIILYKYSRYNAINVNKAASLDRFVDAAHLSAEGYRALQWACAEKLIQGTGSTTLSPNDKALRAQVAVILMRYRTTVAPPPAKPEEMPPEA